MSEYIKNELTELYPYDTIRNVDENNDLILIGHKYMDPFDPDKYLIFQEPDYFMNYYGLTKAQVWNICHGFDKDYIHRCHCGNELQFINFKFGFQQYCSASCKCKIISKLNWQDEDYRAKVLPYLHSAGTIALRNRTEFLQRCQDSENTPYLYLAYTQDYGYEWIKFGVTTMEPYYKRRRDRYIVIHQILFGSPEEVANAEYNLAIKFGGEWFTPEQFKDFKGFFINSKRSGSLFEF